MSRKEQFSIGELEVDNIIGGSGPQGWRKKYYLNAALGSDGNDGLAFDRPLKSLTVADDKIETLKKDCIVLEESASAISLASAYTWSYSMCGLIGTGESIFAKRSRIGMSTTFTPMFTVSGYGNVFKNLYFQHGTAAGDYNCAYVTGNRNVFDNVHFAGPMVEAQGGHASYVGVYVTGSENYFKNCVFGAKSIGRDEVSPNLKIAGGDNVFENCLFVCALTDTDPIFVYVDNATTTNAWFKGCQFFAFSANHANAMAVAFAFSAGASADITLDPNCSFHNVTKLAASASMKYIWTPTVFAATADELNLISINSATY